MIRKRGLHPLVHLVNPFCWECSPAHVNLMEQQFAEAQYEGGHNCPEDDYLAWNTIGIPAHRTTPEGVASYLQFGGRISDRVLAQFVWKGEGFDPLGQRLKDSGKPSAG